MSYRTLLYFSVILFSLSSCLGDDDDNQPGLCEDGLISIEEFATNDALTYTELDNTGLLYFIEEPGTGDRAEVTDSLVFAYTGAVTNGRVFDSRPTDNPLRFRLNRLIQGWQLGIPLIAEGGKIRLLIPSELGYGERGSCNQFGQCSICPNSDLVFDIELIEIVD
jgi:FKBP-type peptidyl-prolyl cis-trans isomerase